MRGRKRSASGDFIPTKTALHPLSQPLFRPDSPRSRASITHPRDDKSHGLRRTSRRCAFRVIRPPPKDSSLARALTAVNKIGKRRDDLRRRRGSKDFRSIGRKRGCSMFRYTITGASFLLLPRLNDPAGALFFLFLFPSVLRRVYRFEGFIVFWLGPPNEQHPRFRAFTSPAFHC